MASILVTLFLATVILAPSLLKLRKRRRLRWAILAGGVVFYSVITWLALRPGGPMGS